MKHLTLLLLILCLGNNFIFSQHTLHDTIKTKEGIQIKKLFTFEPLNVLVGSDGHLLFKNKCTEECEHQCVSRFMQLEKETINERESLLEEKRLIQETLNELENDYKACLETAKNDNNCEGLIGNEKTKCINKKLGDEGKCAKTKRENAVNSKNELIEVNKKINAISQGLRAKVKKEIEALKKELKEDKKYFYASVATDILPRYQSYLEQIGSPGLELDTTSFNALCNLFKDVFNPVPYLPNPPDKGKYFYIDNDLEPHSTTSLDQFFNTLIKRRKNYDLSSNCYKIIEADKVALELELTDSFELVQSGGVFQVGSAYGKYISNTYRNDLLRHHSYRAFGYMKEQSTFSTKNITRDITTYSKVQIEFRYVPLTLAEYEDDDDELGWRGYILRIDGAVKEEWEKARSLKGKSKDKRKNDLEIFDHVDFEDCQKGSGNVDPDDEFEYQVFCCEEGIRWCCPDSLAISGDPDTCCISPNEDFCERLNLDKPAALPSWSYITGAGWYHFRDGSKANLGHRSLGTISIGGIAACTGLSLYNFAISSRNRKIHQTSKTNELRRSYYQRANDQNKDGWLWLGGAGSIYAISTASILLKQRYLIRKWERGFEACEEEAKGKADFPNDFIRHEIFTSVNSTFFNEPIIGLTYQITF